MIWVRRAGAVALAGPLTAILLAALVLLRLGDTLLDPDFLADQLAEADLYGFVLDEALPLAVDEFRLLEPGELGVDTRENPLVASGLDASRTAEAARRALPPEELEALVDPVLRETVAYATGASDTLTIDSQPAANAVRRLATEAKALLRDAGAYELLLERELQPLVREAARDALASGADGSGWTRGLASGDEEAADRIAEAVSGVVTPEWLREQFERNLDELTAWLLGDADGFALGVRPGEAQAEAASAEIAAILGEADSAELVYGEALDPAVDRNLGETVTLPYGVEIGRGEVKAVLREAAPPDWVREQADRLIADVSAYATARTDGFETTIPLAASKERAASLLTELALERLGEALRGLPACAPEAAASAAAALRGGMLPDCLPPDTSADGLLGEARAAIEDSVTRLVLEPVPDAVSYGAADLRRDLRADGGADALAALDDGREFFAEGWSYDDADLRADLASDHDALDALDRVRSFFADGYTHTRADASEGTLADDLEELRDGLNSAQRGAGVVAWLAVAVLLVAIGALGGRSWAGRVAWASGALLASALVVALLWGPVYSAIADLAFDQAREELVINPGEEFEDFEATARRTGEKLIDITESVSGEVAGGIFRSALVVAAVALVVFLVAAFWERIAEAAGRARGRGSARPT